MSSSNNRSITVPKGFRFHPSDVELLTHYLNKKNQGKDSEMINIIPEISLCNHEPRDLPALVFARAEFLDKEWFTVGDTLDMEWYFFSPRDYKYPSSTRSNRTTGEGYWKTQGQGRRIKARESNTAIGRMKTLTFYKRAEPGDKKTNWVIHEYNLTQAHSNDQIGDFVLCRLKKKSDKSDHNKEDSPVCYEAETGSGGSSTVENQAAETGMITEAEENQAFNELVNILSNKDEWNGSPTDSCLSEKNDLSYSVEGQPDSCNSLEMIDELYDESGTLNSIFNPPQPHQLPQLHQTHQPQVYSPSTVQSPTSTNLGYISHTNNVNYGTCHKKKYTFGDNISYPPKKKNIPTNDHDEVLGNAESCRENQATNDRIPQHIWKDEQRMWINENSSRTHAMMLETLEEIVGVEGDETVKMQERAYVAVMGQEPRHRVRGNELGVTPDMVHYAQDDGRSSAPRVSGRAYARMQSQLMELQAKYQQQEERGKLQQAELLQTQQELALFKQLIQPQQFTPPS